MTQAQKAAVRQTMLARRKRFEDSGAALAAQFWQAEIAYPPQTIIAGYMPMGGEIDCRPLMAELAAAGHKICLPVCLEGGAPMAFRLYAPDMSLAPDAVGMPAPPENAAPCTPDLLLIPMLAFDARGYRLGRGGGHYDRTLATLPDAIAVGLAYQAQMIDQCPIEPHDRRMDYVITEAHFYAKGLEK